MSRTGGLQIGLNGLDHQVVLVSLEKRDYVVDVGFGAQVHLAGQNLNRACLAPGGAGVIGSIVWQNRRLVHFCSPEVTPLQECVEGLLQTMGTLLCKVRGMGDMSVCRTRAMKLMAILQRCICSCRVLGSPS